MLGVDDSEVRGSLVCGDASGVVTGGDHTVGGGVSSGVDSDALASVVGTTIDSVGTSVYSSVASGVFSGVGSGLTGLDWLGSVASAVSEGSAGAVVIVGRGRVDSSLVASRDVRSGAESTGHSIDGRSGPGRSVGVVVRGADVVGVAENSEESIVVALGPGRSPGVLPGVVRPSSDESCATGPPLSDGAADWAALPAGETLGSSAGFIVCTP